LQVAIQHHNRKVKRGQLQHSFVSNLRVKDDCAVYLPVKQHPARGTAVRADEQFIIRIEDDGVNPFQNFLVKRAAEARDEHADGVRFTLFQMPREGVGVVIEFLDRIHHALAGRVGDVASVIDHV
jgi:hypothetical protein